MACMGTRLSISSQNLIFFSGQFSVVIIRPAREHSPGPWNFAYCTNSLYHITACCCTQAQPKHPITRILLLHTCYWHNSTFSPGLETFSQLVYRNPDDSVKSPPPPPPPLNFEQEYNLPTCVLLISWLSMK